MITLIAKYYFDKNKEANELINTVKEKMLEFNLDGYQEYKYYKKIKKSCTALYELETENLFRELEYIPIYEEELSLIETLPNDRQKKFMFTLFAIARYMNCDGWINKKNLKGLSEVFKLANVTLPSDKKNELLHELYINGYISFGKKIDNLNIRVSLSSPGTIAYKLTSFENVGNQYIGNFKKGYKQCKCCGKKIKDTGNKKMYCTQCAEENEKNRKRICAKLLRN